jgi:S-adenosylmethionine decarboxylase
LSESHFAIHTFPEEGQSYIELSSCVFEPFLKFVSNIKSDENQTNNGVSA